MKLKLLAAAAIAIPMALAGCVTAETRPIPKIEAKQATVHIPQAELLDVGIRVFDPGIPKNIEGDDEALAKKRIYPDLRKAEARYMPTLLRATLEETAQWGAVRVIPASADFVDVIVTGKVVDSNGGFMAVDISATDAAGRVWIKDKRYSSLVDLGAYKTTAALKARDPFQNVYSEIANDLVLARDKLTALDRENIRKVASLKFAAGPRARCDAGHDRRRQERHHAGRAPARGFGSDARPHRAHPRTRHRGGRHGQRLLRELRRIDRRFLRQLAPDELHGAREGNARQVERAHAHRARRRRADRQHLRAELLQHLRRLPHQQRDAHRRHHGRHRRGALGHQEIRRRAQCTPMR